MIGVRRWAPVAVIVVLAGCVTTGPQPPKPWSVDQRVALHDRLGWDYLRHGRIDTAHDEFQAGLELQPADSLANYGMALVSLRHNDQPAAFAYFDKAVAAPDASPAARNDYAMFLCRDGKIRAGTAQLQAALHTPESQVLAETHSTLGFCLRQSSQADQAETQLKQALAADPRFGPALFQMAELKMAQADYLSARGYLERYLASQSPTPRSLWYALKVERALGDAQGVKRYATLLRTRFPQSAQTRKLLRSESTGGS